LLALIRVKVYGAIRGEKRIIRRGKAFAVKRDGNGRFRSFRKWSPKQPCKRQRYREIYIEGATGREVIRETQRVVYHYDWINPSIECVPYPEIGDWLETWVAK